MNTGDRFGRWTVIGVPLPITAKAKALCRCDCGRERHVRVDNLRRSLSASCGCLRRELATESRRPDMDRFMEKVLVEADSGCWNWTGHLNENGYGRFYDGRRHRPAHRWIAEKSYGSLTGDREPDHLCRNRSCVNPEHLEVVTHRVNTRRAKYAIAECSGGHLLPAPDANGRRVCRRCANKRNRQYKARKRMVRAQYDAITGGGA